MVLALEEATAARMAVAVVASAKEAQKAEALAVASAAVELAMPVVAMAVLAPPVARETEQSCMAQARTTPGCYCPARYASL